MQANRLYFIDAVRAFAILMMLQGHFIDTLIDPVFRNPDNAIYNLWTYFRGITAPTFFTISGLVFTYLLLKSHAKGNDQPRIKKGLFRGLLLLGIGYSLRINIFDWFCGYFDTYFLVIDVLQCIGLSLIILVCLHILFKHFNYLFSFILFGVGCLCFISEPLYRNLEISNLPLMVANYMTKINGSVFTILPWFGYSAFGAFISTIFFRHVHKKRFKPLIIITFIIAGYFFIYHSSWFLTWLFYATDIELLKLSADYNYLFTRFGNVLIVFAIFYAFERFLKQLIILKIGEKTLSIYVIHFVILYGSYTGYGLKRFFDKSLNPTEAIIGTIVFMIIVCFASFYYAKTNTYIYNLLRKMIDTIKTKKQDLQ
ncbi:heparan-alpha-glucosaminide N-acetyltransferase domain-containing protein [uncultured Algibacter sp.]|uniref:heparan-alpha-glucosaminide N-acetyltransferase domain-containing protein n=1 Tax=uncultured Algibacter sp. TaxID=298659 RepID=UPI0032169DFC